MNLTQDSNRVWVVIPAKALTEGKTRLAPVLSADGRERLNRQFLEHTLGVATAMHELDGVLVVSSDEAALDIARTHGACTLEEVPAQGLNPALTLASQWLAARDVTHVMTVSADLPHLRRPDLGAVIETALTDAPSGRSVTIAPDEDGQGTNVMVMSPPGVIAYQYGVGSYARHRAASLTCDAVFREVRRPGLIFDVDSPEDLRRWKETATPDEGHAVQAQACAAR